MPSAKDSLRRYYERTYQPQFLPDAKAKTLAAYNETLNLWEKLFPKKIPLDRITSTTLAEFRQLARATDLWSVARAPATVNKHLRHLNALLAKAGPPGPGNRDALRLIAEVPWARPLKTPKKRPRFVTPDELAVAIAAAEKIRYPRIPGLKPADWWHALFTAAILLAARRGTLLALRWSHIDWTTCQVRYDSEIDKEGECRSKPLHPVLRAHLIKIRTPSDLIFPWPHDPRHFDRCMTRLSGGSWHLHDLKKTAATLGSRVGSQFALRMFCDHASSQTTEKFYVDASEELVDLVARFPVPDCLKLSEPDKAQEENHVR